MIILIILFFLHFFIGQFIERFKLKSVSILMAFLLLIVVYYFTLGLEYTADYGMYENFFRNNFKTDFLFMKLSKLFSFYHYKFHDLYVFHILVSVLIYYSFISKFSNNVFYIFLAYILLDYVHFSNQIRYFLGFPIMLWAFYFLYQKKYIFFTILAIIACLSHSALTVVITFVPMYLFIKPQKFLKYCLFLSLLCFAIVYVAFSMGLGREIDHFGEYFKKDGVSSFFGGAFNSLPYIMFVTFLYIETRIYMAHNLLWYEDRTFVFLNKLSFYTIVFIPASFFLQIAGHRYVMPFVIIYGIYFLYMIRNYSPQMKLKKIFLYSSVCLVISIFMYILPTFILKENTFLDELEIMLKSIKYLDYKAW